LVRAYVFQFAAHSRSCETFELFLHFSHSNFNLPQTTFCNNLLLPYRISTNTLFFVCLNKKYLYFYAHVHKPIRCSLFVWNEFEKAYTYSQQCSHKSFQYCEKFQPSHLKSHNITYPLKLFPVTVKKFATFLFYTPEILSKCKVNFIALQNAVHKKFWVESIRK